MVNKQKRKGTDWERQLVKILNKKIEGAEFKRVPGSGALGTIMNESRLSGDVKGRIEFISKEITGEAKTGYGGSKQLTIKREWLRKVREEAEASYSIPMLFCKFSDAKTGVKQFVVMDMEAFIEVMQEGNKIYQTLIRAEEKMDKILAKLGVEEIE